MQKITKALLELQKEIHYNRDRESGWSSWLLVGFSIPGDLGSTPARGNQQQKNICIKKMKPPSVPLMIKFARRTLKKIASVPTRLKHTS